MSVVVQPPSPHPVELNAFQSYQLQYQEQLVNDLNKDNEVLLGNLEDTNMVLQFLTSKHKKLKEEHARTVKQLEVVEAYKLKVRDMEQEL
jgi:hypothetical protein